METTEKQALALRDGQDWIEQELAASTLPDARLDKRLRYLVEQLAKGVGQEYSLGLSGLGGGQGRLPVFLQRPGQ
jgi:hypothetical protein